MAATRAVVALTSSAQRRLAHRGGVGCRAACRRHRAKRLGRPARRSWRHCDWLDAWVGAPRRRARRIAKPGAGSRLDRRRRPHVRSANESAGSRRRRPVWSGEDRRGVTARSGCRGVDADDAVDELCQMACGGPLWGGRVGVGLGESPRGTTADGQPCGLDRLLIRPARWARPTPAPANRTRQPIGCQLHNESYRGASRA